MASDNGTFREALGTRIAVTLAALQHKDGISTVQRWCAAFERARGETPAFSDADADLVANYIGHAIDQAES